MIQKFWLSQNLVSKFKCSSITNNCYKKLKIVYFGTPRKELIKKICITHISYFLLNVFLDREGFSYSYE